MSLSFDCVYEDALAFALVGEDGRAIVAPDDEDDKPPCPISGVGGDYIERRMWSNRRYNNSHARAAKRRRRAIVSALRERACE